MSRVGSTLAANALAAMDPAGHRVYSEAHPVNDALKACDGRPACDAGVGAALLRDVVYLMGRTASPRERRLFFKVSSVGAKRIAVVQEAFPAVPWIFVYRDPGECADDLSYQEFCAAHLATLCWSAVRSLRDAGGRGVAAVLLRSSPRGYVTCARRRR